MQEGDMIANLTHLPAVSLPQGIQLKRVFPADKARVLQFIRENFGDGWANEAEHAIMQEPVKCFIATENGKVLGFSCFDASARAFFGPIGVLESERGKNIGTALLIRTLESMREYGYIYAIIGWVGDAADFYRKVLGAEFIPGGEPQNSVYANMIRM